MLALMEDGLEGVPVGTVLGIDPVTGKQITAARRRIQSQSAKDAISRFQQAKHAKARAEKAETEETNLCGPVGV
jgi:hypothetical protein